MSDLWHITAVIMGVSRERSEADLVISRREYAIVKEFLCSPLERDSYIIRIRIPSFNLFSFFFLFETILMTL